MEKDTLTHIALYKEFKVADSFEKKIEIFKVWLEAIVKLNLSIHVGWLIKESGDSTPDFIKVQLVNFFQKPPSIGTCLSLSRSINNLIEKRNKSNGNYLPFQQVFFHHDKLYSRLLELRNAHAHSSGKISEEDLEVIAADMRTIALNSFYKDINLSFIKLSAHLLEQGILTDKDVLDEPQNILYVPVIEIDGIINGTVSPTSIELSFDYTLTVSEKIPLFPISVSNKSGKIFYWNQRKAQHGSYNSYDFSSESLNVKNITSITGFPFDDWKQSSDPLFVKYLELRNRVLESSQNEPSISLSSLSDDINLVKHIENELNLRPSDCMVKSQWLNVLYRRVTIEQDIEIRKYYLKYIVINCEAEVSLELIRMALNCTEALFECELGKRKQSGLIAYYLKVLFNGYRFGIDVVDRCSKMLVLTKKRTSKFSYIISKYRGWGLLTSLLAFCSLLFHYNLFITISATALSTVCLYDFYLGLPITRFLTLPLKEISINSEFNVRPYEQIEAIGQLFTFQTFKKHGTTYIGKELNTVSNHDSMIGSALSFRFQEELYKYIYQQLKEGVTKKSLNELHEFIDSIWHYSPDLRQYSLSIYRVVQALYAARYLDDIIKYGNILHNLNKLKNENPDSVYLNIWLNDCMSSLNKEDPSHNETAANLNLLEIYLWRCEIRALKYESDPKKLLEMKKFRQKIYNENNSASEDKTKSLDIVERIATGNIWKPANPFVEEQLIRTRGIWLYEIGLVNEALQELYLSLKFNVTEEMPFTLYNIALLEGLRKNAISCFSMLKKLKRYLGQLDDEEREKYTKLVSYTDTRLASFGAVDNSTDIAMPPNWNIDLGDLFISNFINVSPNEVRSLKTYSQQ